MGRRTEVRGGGDAVAVLRFVSARAAQAVAVVVLVATLVFFLLHLAPGDPFGAAIDNPNVTEAIRARWRAAYGLDRPVPEQYVRYVLSVARGDLGWSFSAHRPVSDVLADALPNTLLLAGTALVLAFAAGVTIGLVQGSREGSWTDRAIGTVSLVLYSVPDFWLALMVMLLFSFRLGLFPVGGMLDPALHDIMGAGGRLGDRAWHLVLPAGTLALLLAAGIARYQRSEVLRVLPEEFVRAARARGVPEFRVLTRHVLRNALVPAVTLLGLALPVLFTGAVFVERVFAWPGLGLVALEAVSARDYPLVTGAVILAAAAVAAGSVLADVLYAVIDPRVRDGR